MPMSALWRTPCSLLPKVFSPVNDAIVSPSLFLSEMSATLSLIYLVKSASIWSRSAFISASETKSWVMASSVGLWGRGVEGLSADTAMGKAEQKKSRAIRALVRFMIKVN